jgi:hypothetical protein
MYRIAWISKSTHLAGHGEYCLSRANAEEAIQQLNYIYKNINHWIERKPDTIIPEVITYDMNKSKSIKEVNIITTNSKIKIQRISGA